MSGYLNALGLPAHLDEKAELEEGLGDITTRLKKALNRFDEDENEDDEFDSIERDAFHARYESMTARMEAMAQERNALLSSLADWLDTSENVVEIPFSRPESRVSQRTSSAEPDKIESPTGMFENVRFDNVVTTRIGVEKLKRLNEDMVSQAVQGREMEHIAKEESHLQKKVVTKFKTMMDAKKRKVIGKTFGAHWKHASEEICDLLKRIRQEGGSGIEELGGQLERASRAIQRQAEEMQRLEAKVEDKDKEIEKAKVENGMLSNDNMLLKSEKERYRDQIMKYRRRFRQQQQEEAEAAKTPPQELSDAEEEELKRLATPTTPVVSSSPYKAKYKKKFQKKQKRTPSTSKKTTSNPPSSEPTSSIPERPQTPDRAGGSQFDEQWHLEEENFDLKDKAIALEKKLIEKENKIFSLEHQMNELIDTLNEFNPEVLITLDEHLSVRGHSIEDIATAIRNVTQPTLQDGKIQTKDSNAKFQTKSETRKKSSAKERNSRKTSGKKADATPSPRGSPILLSDDQASNAPSPTVPYIPLRSEADSELIKQLTADSESLQQELKNAKQELRRSQWELLSLRHVSSQRGVVASFPTRGIPSKVVAAAETDTVTNGRQSPSASMMAMTLESHGRETYDPNSEEKPTAKALANLMKDYLPSDTKEANNVEYDDEFQAYADLIRTERGKFKQRLYTRPKMIGVIRTDGRKSVSESTPTPGEMEEYMVEDQGMQTDPTMDPLGAWSNVPTIKMDKNKRPDKSQAHAKVVTSTTAPRPPKEWTLFDPTALQDLTQDNKLSLGDIFEKKEAPKHIDNASDLINFVEAELRRLTQGISGYTEYLNTLIDKEVSSMANHNDDLRRKLSANTLKQMDKMRELTSRGADAQTGDVEKSGRKEMAPIRKGRFELAKPGKCSRFTTRRAFGNYLAGRRFLIQQGELPEELQTQQMKTRGGQPYPWETYAKDHIYRAEMEAAERKEVEKLAASRASGPSDMLKQQVDQIAQHAIDVLQGTTNFFKETLSNQLEEYGTLQGAVELKHELTAALPSSAKKTRLRKEDEIAHALTMLSRSTSHCSFLVRQSPLDHPCSLPPSSLGPTNTPMAGLHIPSQTQSLSSIQSSHRYLPPLLLYKEAEPRNRHQYKLPKATLPKKGMVTLAVSDITNKSTHNEQNKPYDTKRRHRPAPQTHEKLLKKQNNIVRKSEKVPENPIESTNILELRNHVLTFPTGSRFTGGHEDNGSNIYTNNDKSSERKHLIMKANEQLRAEGAASINKYNAVL